MDPEIMGGAGEGQRKFHVHQRAPPAQAQMCNYGVQGPGMEPTVGIQGLKPPDALAVLHIKSSEMGSRYSVKKMLYHFHIL